MNSRTQRLKVEFKTGSRGKSALLISPSLHFKRDLPKKGLDLRKTVFTSKLRLRKSDCQGILNQSSESGLYFPTSTPQLEIAELEKKTVIKDHFSTALLLND